MYMMYSPKAKQYLEVVRLKNDWKTALDAGELTIELKQVF